MILKTGFLRVREVTRKSEKERETLTTIGVREKSYNKNIQRYIFSGDRVTTCLFLEFSLLFSTS